MNSISKALIITGKLFTQFGNGIWEPTTLPSEKWVKNLNVSINGFIKTIDSLEEIDEDKFDYLEHYTYKLIFIGKIFTKYGTGLWDLTSIPSVQWGTQVSSVVSDLSNSDINLSKIYDFYESSKFLFWSARWLSRMNEYPMGDGVINFSNAISLIMKALPNDDNVEPFLLLVKAFQDLANISWLDMLKINLVGDVIKNIADDIDYLNEDKISSLLKLGAGFQMISLIDDKKLENVLKILDEKTEGLKNVVEEKSFVRNLLDDLFKPQLGSANSKSISTNNGPIVEEFSPFEKKLLSHIENIDINITEMTTKEELTPEEEEELKARNIN